MRPQVAWTRGPTSFVFFFFRIIASVRLISTTMIFDFPLLRFYFRGRIQTQGMLLRSYTPTLLGIEFLPFLLMNTGEKKKEEEKSDQSCSTWSQGCPAVSFAEAFKRNTRVERSWSPLTAALLYWNDGPLRDGFLALLGRNGSVFFYIFIFTSSVRESSSNHGVTCLLHPSAVVVCEWFTTTLDNITQCPIQ